MSRTAVQYAYGDGISARFVHVDGTWTVSDGAGFFTVHKVPGDRLDAVAERVADYQRRLDDLDEKRRSLLAEYQRWSDTFRLTEVSA